MTLVPPPLQGASCETVITLPDTWAAWSWNRRLNPFYASASAESLAWIRGHKLYTPEAQHVFERSDFEQIRVTCDFIQFIFAFDDAVEKKDESSARIMALSVVNALEAVETPDLENDVWGVIVRELWQRFILVVPNTIYQHRFVSAMKRYTDAVVQEARYHHQRHIPDIPEYFALRRETSALFPAWIFLHMGLDLPKEVFDDPVVQEIEQLAADMVIISNDMVSYRPESSRDEHHNLLAVLTELHGLSVQEAMMSADSKGKALLPAAENAQSRLPTFGEKIDRDLSLYVTGLFAWVKAYDCWIFETPRYFGNDGERVREHRQIVLRADL
ncbi:terpenoid synthase [Auricularia subglabra TFB-10046 SS5]|nr:terpenoid synthase [Auricularia subglabra TFB-10046 SS5]